ncbi:MAG TPA: hypothetical protein VGR92_22825 [Steroidobacteraceae bacterium]|nr:hypothetical protein [Steroidobacteraceae bacterium]
MSGLAQMPSSPRGLAAALIAAWVATLIVAFVGGCIEAEYMASAGSGGLQLPRSLDDVSALTYGGIVALAGAIPVSAIVAVVIAAPLFVLLRRRGYRSFGAFLLAGIALSAICTILLASCRAIQPDFLGLDSNLILAVPLVLTAGPVAALVFRAVDS